MIKIVYIRLKMADADKILVFKDHENQYWMDSKAKMRFPRNMKVYCNDTLYPGKYFANEELSVEFVLEWLPRTTELYTRRELGKPSFYDQVIPRIASTQPAQPELPLLLHSKDKPLAFQPDESHLQYPGTPTALLSTITPPTQLSTPTATSLPSTVVSPLTSPVAVPGTSTSATSDVQELGEMEEADGFTKNESKFFIELMRKHLLMTSNKLPSSIAELQERINLGKGKRKLLWQDLAQKMSAAFGKKFLPEKLQRKWKGLQDSFKKAKANNEATGRAPSKFQYFEEMRDLIGGQHDIDFPVTATAKSIIVHRPEEVFENQEVDDPDPVASAVPGPSTDPIVSEPVAGPSSAENQQPARRQRKKQKESDSELLTFLRESDERHTDVLHEILQQMKQTEESIRDLISELIKK